MANPPAGPSNQPVSLSPAGHVSSPADDQEEIGKTTAGHTVTANDGETLTPESDANSLNGENSQRAVNVAPGEPILGAERPAENQDIEKLNELLHPEGSLAKSYKQKAENQYLDKSEKILDTLLNGSENYEPVDWDNLSVEQCFDSFKNLSDELTEATQNLKISIEVDPYKKLCLIPPDPSLAGDHNFKKLVRLALTLAQTIQEHRPIDQPGMESKIAQKEQEFGSLMQGLDKEGQEYALNELARLQNPMVYIDVKGWELVWPESANNKHDGSSYLKPGQSQLVVTNSQEFEHEDIEDVESLVSDTKTEKYRELVMEAMARQAGISLDDENERQQFVAQTNLLGQLNKEVKDRSIDKDTPDFYPHESEGSKTPLSTKHKVPFKLDGRSSKPQETDEIESVQTEKDVGLNNSGELIRDEWQVLGWQNQESVPREDSPFAIGGRVGGEFIETTQSQSIQQKLVAPSMGDQSSIRTTIPASLDTASSSPSPPSTTVETMTQGIAPQLEEVHDRKDAFSGFGLSDADRESMENRQKSFDEIAQAHKKIKFLQNITEGRNQASHLWQGAENPQTCVIDALAAAGYSLDKLPENARKYFEEYDTWDQQLGPDALIQGIAPDEYNNFNIRNLTINFGEIEIITRGSDGKLGAEIKGIGNASQADKQELTQWLKTLYDKPLLALRSENESGHYTVWDPESDCFITAGFDQIDKEIEQREEFEKNKQELLNDIAEISSENIEEIKSKVSGIDDLVQPTGYYLNGINPDKEGVRKDLQPTLMLINLPAIIKPATN